MASGVPKQEPAFVPRDRRAYQDQVKLDGVMKELVQNQKKSIGVWESRWAFLKNPRKLWEAEAHARGLPEDIFDRANERRLPEQWGSDREPTARLQPCDTPPTLSSGMVGWRAKDSNNHLDHVAGPLFISPQQTMEPPLGPNEPDPKKQRFIFLG